MTMASFDAVCFDMDGVLIDSRQVIEAAWGHVARTYGIHLDEAAIREHIHGRPGNYTLEVLFGARPKHELPAIKRRVDAIEETSQCPLLPGVRKILDALRQVGMPCALVTSSWPGRIEYILQMHGLRHAFQRVISREDVSVGKPDPQGYRFAMESLGVPADRCLVFEDSRSGVLAAVASGARCIAIGDEPDLRSLGALAQYPDFRALSTQLLPVNVEGGSFIRLNKAHGMMHLTHAIKASSD